LTNQWELTGKKAWQSSLAPTLPFLIEPDHPVNDNPGLLLLPSPNVCLPVHIPAILEVIQMLEVHEPENIRYLTAIKNAPGMTLQPRESMPQIDQRADT